MKLNMKIAVLFALLLASMSWGDYVNELFLSYGSSSDAKSVISSKTDYFVTNQLTNEKKDNGDIISHNDKSFAQDLLANTGCGGSCYAFMGYKTTTHVKNINGSAYTLPITNIIVKTYSKANPENSFVQDGATYYRLYQYKKDGTSLGTNDICNNKCSDSKHVYIYYTRDNIDGNVVRDIKASTETSLSGYTRIAVDLTGGKGSKPIYLFVDKTRPYSDLSFLGNYPYGRNSDWKWNRDYVAFTGTSRTLLSPLGTPFGDHIDHVEYKINDGPWSRSVPTAVYPGTYRVYAKIVSNHADYTDYIYGEYESTKMVTPIHKADSLIMNQYENGEWSYYYLYDAKFENQWYDTYNAGGISSTVDPDFYSGDKISIRWSDKCKSAPVFYYSKDGGSATYTFTSGMTLNSGSYKFMVSFNETDYCEAMVHDSIASFIIKKSKMTFNSNGGSAVADIEGERNESYTKPANPTRTGYSFTGWDPALPSTFPRGENTYTAQWKINQYTITLSAGGGQFKDGSSVKEITQNYGTTVATPEKPTRTDYTFARWRLTYPRGMSSSTKIPTKMPATNMTFVAQWTYNRFKVNMPEQMEVVSGDIADDGTYLKGSTVKFTPKSGYLVRGDLTYNGASVVPDKNGVYAITVASKDADVVAEMVEDHGAIQIAADHSKAYIDGDKTSLAANVPVSTDVAAVEMTRTFTPYSTTTITFPFTIDLEYVWGGVFCKFLGMDKSGFKYTARLMFISTELKANEPYVFVPLDEHISIDLPAGETIAIKTEEKSVKFGDWSFNSLYHEKVWKDGVSEGDVEGAVGYCFNPSDEEVDGVSGSFAKLKSGSVGSMQAYIAYAKNAPQAVRSTVNAAKSTKSVFDIDDLPDEIGIEVVTEDKKTVALGKMNTVTGKIKLNAWFDMKGNLLKSKPTAKGVYFYNGNQVIVK